MKISDKIAASEAAGEVFWSFEFFPPKTEAGRVNLDDRMARMKVLAPSFVDVTWNAGGSSSDVTLDICAAAQNDHGLETCMHLTCTNMPRAKIDEALERAKDIGVRNILALRGDPPRGSESWTAVDTGFSHADDLVSYIRKQHGDTFCIGVAGYPEGHADALSVEEDVLMLKRKVDCGADYIVTQLFYDVDVFLSWVKQCRDAGINVPILPGIMPIQNYAGFKRMTTLCKTFVPEDVLSALEPIKDDDRKVREYGVQLAVEMCNKMRANGVLGFHFYTLNLERSTRLILERFLSTSTTNDVTTEGGKNITNDVNGRILPWQATPPSETRRKENVRPIFWNNRPGSYISRTSEWDEFPNGRWGDSRSPAYGDIDGHSVPLVHTRDEALAMWRSPVTQSDVFNLFASYCRGELRSLPWSDTPLAPESSYIRTRLIDLNTRGFLTINSQPAVNCAPSSHAAYGWGPRNGFVFQKAYLEFFVSPKTIQKVISALGEHPYVTFYAVNRAGDFRTNTNGDGANAVTWGVFPGQEIAQPTVVEAVSFIAWKDEAFHLWAEWAALYAPGSKSRDLLDGMYNDWYLMNIVDNNFNNTDAFFDFLDSVSLTE